MWRWVWVSIAIVVLGATLATALTVGESISITATVTGTDIPLIESTTTQTTGSGSTSPVSTGIVTFYGTTVPNGAVLVSQVGGGSVRVVADASGAFSGSLVAMAGVASVLAFTPILASGEFGLPSYVPVTVPSAYVTTIQHVVLGGASDMPTDAAAPTQSPGDCDDDDIINDDDFVVLRYWYGQRTFPACADLNSDGAITLQDFALLSYRWHTH